MKNIIKLFVFAITLMATQTTFAQQPSSAAMPPGTVPAGVYYNAKVLMPTLEDATIGDRASATRDDNGDGRADLIDSGDISRNDRILPAKFLINGTWVMGCMLFPNHIASDLNGKGWIDVAAIVKANKITGSQQSIGLSTTATYWMMVPQN